MAYGDNMYQPFQPAGYGNQFTNRTISTPVNTQLSNNQNGLMTIFVTSEDEVTNYPVAAGLTVLLISFNLKKFWLKSTDTSGIPQRPRLFTFDEKTPSTNQNGSFVSRQEFQDLNNKLDKLIAELGGTKNE